MSPSDTVDAADLVGWIRARLPRTGRFVFGLAGPPGCGKSTIAEMIAPELDAPVVPMDGYHLSNSVLAARGLIDVKGAPRTFDVDAFVSMLRELRDGRDVWVPDFDRVVDEPLPGRIHVPAEAPVVIVEGNYLLLPESPWGAVVDLLDATGFIDLDAQTRVRRLIARHVEFGRTTDEARAFVHDSDEPNATLVASSRHRADVMISGG